MSQIQELHDAWTDREFILKYGQQAEENGRPVFLGNLQRSGWTGRIPTYLVWCEDCRYRENRGFTVAHEAGFDRRIACATCRARFDRRFRPLLIRALIFIAFALILLLLMRR